MTTPFKETTMPRDVPTTTDDGQDQLYLTPQGMRAVLHLDAKAKGKPCPLPRTMPDGSPCCELCFAEPVHA